MNELDCVRRFGFPLGNLFIGAAKMDEQGNKDRKPYEKPTATPLTEEQARLKLIPLAMEGDQGAQERLELMFPETLDDRKRSA